MREQLHLENSFIVYEQEQVRSGDASDTFPRDQISLTRKNTIVYVYSISTGYKSTKYREEGASMMQEQKIDILTSLQLKIERRWSWCANLNTFSRSSVDNRSFPCFCPSCVCKNGRLMFSQQQG